MEGTMVRHRGIPLDENIKLNMGEIKKYGLEGGSLNRLW
jgi:hypothetical protein